MKLMRHPIADVFHGVVLASFERDVFMKEWDIIYEMKRHPDNSFMQAKYNKRLVKLKVYTLYDFFKQDKYSLKFYDEIKQQIKVKS